MKKCLCDFADSVILTCNNCELETKINNRVRVRYKDEKSDMVMAGYLLAYQCQSCGRFKSFGMFGQSFEGLINERCSCGGEFRRDKHLFCNKCFSNQDKNAIPPAKRIYRHKIMLLKIFSSIHKYGYLIVKSFRK